MGIYNIDNSLLGEQTDICISVCINPTRVNGSRYTSRVFSGHYTQYGGVTMSVTVEQNEKVCVECGKESGEIFKEFKGQSFKLCICVCNLLYYLNT